jgi:hypothetical protein
MALWLEHYRAIFVAKRTVSSPAGYTVLYSSVSTNKTHANALFVISQDSAWLWFPSLKSLYPPYLPPTLLKMLCPIIPSLIHTLTLTSRPTVPT